MTNDFFQYIILGVTYVGLELGYLPGLRMNRATIAFMGAACLVGKTRLPPRLLGTFALWFTFNVGNFGNCVFLATVLVEKVVGWAMPTSVEFFKLISERAWRLKSSVINNTITLCTVMTVQPSVPSNDRAWYQQGMTQMEGEQYEEAIASFDRALEIQADEFKIWWARGNALYGLERTEEAITDYDRALQLQPDSHQLWLWRGKVLTSLKRHYEALFSYEKALEIQREIGDRRAEVDTPLNLATVSPVNGKIREGFLAQKRAIEIAQELELTPDDPLYSLSSQDIKLPSQFDVLIEKMGWVEKIINFGRQGKFQWGLVLIVWLLYFLLSVALSPIALVLWFFRQPTKRPS